MKRTLFLAVAGGVGVAVAFFVFLRAKEPAMTCPNPLRAEPVRAARLRELLARAPAGHQLLQQLPSPLRICFGEVDVAVWRTDGIVVFPPSGQAREDAARLGHLLLHAVEGPPLPETVDRSRSCRGWARRAVAAEARAYTLELRLRRQFRVSQPRQRYPFEAQFWAAEHSRQNEVVRSYLLAHPAGSEGFIGYFNAYVQRCQQLQQAAGGGPGG